MDLCGDILDNVSSIDNVPDGTAAKMYGEDSSGNLIKDDVPSGELPEGWNTGDHLYWTGSEWNINDSYKYILEEDYARHYFNGIIYNNYLEGNEGDGDRIVVAAENGQLITELNSIVLKKIKVTLTPAQIRALHTTPIELIAAPGEDKLIVINSLIAYYKYIDAAYTGGNEINIIYNSISGQTAVYDDISVILASSDKITIQGLGTRLATNMNPSTVINKNVVITASNAITNDNANGTLIIELTYHITDLT